MQKKESEALGVEEYEAFELVARELHAHFASERKNFAVRVPLNLVSYLFNGILQKSQFSKIQLENAVLELGFSVEARTLRRYISGHSRMTWGTFQQLVLWARSQEWISAWMCRDLILRAQVCEAAQLSARELLNKRKRLFSPSGIRREQAIDCFYANLSILDLERGEKAMKQVRRHDQVRELARSLGLNTPDDF
ncbi:hypothetical protein L6218_14835 [Pseudomonas syringae pv. syringae]|uniref:Uncharacterized protein n=2 Tax=Pseudomonas syringae group TaxID=136849 RepID=A0AA40P879_9PSED|nr:MULTISPECIES: hypothetical protein [Pseudomonas syringae group]KPX06645.1 hypothetical protein ALO74_102184 [Pseudomonas syringae pv. cunninghamiae]KPZ06729.1 hypothetical protein ALO43_101129 [Pseudomonas tremae]MCH5499495.1 hypothetical protein [Pseudomonas syringae pv. syringae]MCH5525640.1 hypothetical protein [Pseudomonas syringae pv. syringae]MCH5560736.1 hypothetical protein [Pseudomonas syringae pv. syringae]